MDLHRMLGILTALGTGSIGCAAANTQTREVPPAQADAVVSDVEHHASVEASANDEDDTPDADDVETTADVVAAPIVDTVVASEEPETPTPAVAASAPAKRKAKPKAKRKTSTKGEAACGEGTCG